MCVCVCVIIVVVVIRFKPKGCAETTLTTVYDSNCTCSQRVQQLTHRYIPARAFRRYSIEEALLVSGWIKLRDNGGTRVLVLQRL